MNTTIAQLCATALAGLIAAPCALATPEDDKELFQSYFAERFPKVPFEAFQDGVYAIDPVGRANWEAIEEFPPYETAIDNGKQMWETPFANGKTYKECLPEGPGIAGKYPLWDKTRGMVVTLSLAINECREANGEQPLKYGVGPIAELTAYIAMESRNQVTAVEIPADDPRALAAYEKGRQFYFARRGQFNFSCAHCHMGNSGTTLRTEILSPALGHTTHWPVYRSTWGHIGTLDFRFKGCNEQVRAKAFEPQGEEYRNLEYFLTYVNNGQVLNGPGSRK